MKNENEKQTKTKMKIVKNNKLLLLIKYGKLYSN
jgi:hypothetical protein